MKKKQCTCHFCKWQKEKQIVCEHKGSINVLKDKNIYCHDCGAKLDHDKYWEKLEREGKETRRIAKHIFARKSATKQMLKEMELEEKKDDCKLVECFECQNQFYIKEPYKLCPYCGKHWNVKYFFTSKKDYSKFIGSNFGHIAIKGNKWLFSLEDGRVEYSKPSGEIPTLYGEIPKYEIVKQSELKEGDVVCFEPERDIEKLKFYNFGIYVGRVVDTFHYQRLNTYYKGVFEPSDKNEIIEIIQSKFIDNQKKLMVRFLRK